MTVKRGQPTPTSETAAATTAAHGDEHGFEDHGHKQQRPVRLDLPGHTATDHGTDQEAAQRGEAGREGEAGRSGGGEADQDDVAGHVVGEDVTEAEEADGVEHAAGHREGGQGHHEGLGRSFGLAHEGSTFPATDGGPGHRQGNGDVSARQ